MIEATTSATTRRIIADAHEERAKVTRGIWGWIFGSTSR